MSLCLLAIARIVSKTYLSISRLWVDALAIIIHQARLWGVQLPSGQSALIYARSASALCACISMQAAVYARGTIQIDFALLMDLI
jgi:hypothetical protein